MHCHHLQIFWFLELLQVLEKLLHSYSRRHDISMFLDFESGHSDGPLLRSRIRDDCGIHHKRYSHQLDECHESRVSIGPSLQELVWSSLTSSTKRISTITRGHSTLWSYSMSSRTSHASNSSIYSLVIGPHAESVHTYEPLAILIRIVGWQNWLNRGLMQILDSLSRKWNEFWNIW